MKQGTILQLVTESIIFPVCHIRSSADYSAEISGRPTRHFAVRTSEEKSKLGSTCPTGQAEISQEFALRYGGY